MEYASELLHLGYKSSEVAIKVGYGEKSIIEFNKMFQKHFGITPKKYKMRHSVKVRN
jgi:YesN/AraC family two-component response regulator